MVRPFLDRYRIPVLISLVFSLGLIVLGEEESWINGVLIIIGSLIGAFLPDIEYFIDSYLLKTDSDQTRELKTQYQTSGLRGVVHYLNENEYQFKEMPIRSLLFMFMLTMFTFYVIATNSWVFAQGMMFSMYANMIYIQLVELIKSQTLIRWFWIYNGNPPKNVYWAYLGLLALFLAFLFRFV